jgi:hypothetical protein
MRNLPARRVPRNFTLDPALYGRPQRQPFAGAYPVLRTATAVTAFLFVIALAVNLYMGGVLDSVTLQPAAEPMMETAVQEVTVTRVVTETVVEESIEQPAEAFVLEESGAAETDSVPLGVEEAPPDSAAADEAAPEMEVAEGEELLSQKPEEPLLSLDLETVEATGLPPALAESAPAPTLAAEMPQSDAQAAEEPLMEAESLAVEQAPRPTAVPEREQAPEPAPEAEQLIVQPAAEDEAAAPVPSMLFSTLNLLVIGLGLLFIMLVVLTLLARERR